MRKSSITILGVMLFLITGMAVKFFIPSNNNKEPNIVRERETNFQPTITEIKEAPVTEPAPAPKITDIYIYVTGEVNKPGVYKLSSDARIFQAIEAAGGFTAKADQASINLAEHMIDGLQLEVIAKGKKVAQTSRTKSQTRTVNQAPVKIIQPNPPKTSTTSAKSTKQITNGQVDINNASEQELTQLKGVGPSIAKRIIQYRNTHGRFTKVDDLLGVRGIGEKTLEKMRTQILIR